MSIRKSEDSAEKAVNAYLGHGLPAVGGWGACSLQSTSLVNIHVTCGPHTDLRVQLIEEENTDCYEVGFSTGRSL